MSEYRRRQPSLQPIAVENSRTTFSMPSQQTLLEYLHQVIGLESSIMVQEDAISAYNTSSMARKPVYTPYSVTERKPVMPVYTSPDTRPWICGIVFFTFTTIIQLPILLNDDPSMTGTGGAIVLTSVIALLAIGCFIGCVSSKISTKKAYQDSLENYNAKLENYNRKCQQIREKNCFLKEENAELTTQWTASNEEVLMRMNTPLNETKQALDALYSLNWIYPKYRNLPALTSICEYFTTGRCTELTGPYGAYNLYEDEVRKDTVISQLNAVVENLEKIKQNQYMLYEQVKNIQYNTYQISRELNEIKGYTINIAELTALNTYYASVTAQNTKALAYYHFLFG